MLYWHFRNIQCILAGLFKRKILPTESVVKTFWANVFDTDYLNSIQAGRYFTYSDAARWELAVRMGFLKLEIRNKWVVIIGGQKIIYGRPIRTFRRFSITMRITGWDDKWIYVAHAFRQRDKICVVSFSKIGLRSAKGLVSPIEVFEQMGHEHIVPPPWVTKHFQDDLETLVTAYDKLLPALAEKT